MIQIHTLHPNPLNFGLGLYDYHHVRKNIKGNLIRKVFILFYSLSEKKAYTGILYIATENILLHINNFKGITKLGLGSSVLFELEQTDKVTLLDDNALDLQSIYNSVEFARKTQSLSTSGPISYLLINKEYVVLHSIEPERGYSWTSDTLIFSDGYVTETQNLKTTIDQVLNKKEIDTNIELPGISSQANQIINMGLVKLKRSFPQFFENFLVHYFSVIPTEFRFF